MSTWPAHPLRLRPQEPDSGDEASAALAPGKSDVRGEALDRIRKSLVTSRLTLASETAGGNPYDSGRGRSPGSVWGQRRR